MVAHGVNKCGYVEEKFETVENIMQSGYQIPYFPICLGASGRADEHRRAEQANKASSAEQANESAARARLLSSRNKPLGAYHMTERKGSHSPAKC